MNETGLTKNQVIKELTRSAHGALQAYVPIGRPAAQQDPEFFAHLIAWNELHGQVRDAKVALPVLALASTFASDSVFPENALAHLAKLDPRNFVRALDFAHEIKTPGRGRQLRKLVERYLRIREANPSWWERTALQHKASLKTLYAKHHLKPGKAEYQIILNHRLAKGAPRCAMPANTVFSSVAQLKDMPAGEAATFILEKRIPFLVAVGTLGPRLKTDDALCIALIERMSPTELVTNTKMLERLGVRTRPALRASFELALLRVALSKKSTLKTSVAAAAVESEVLKTKLRVVQEKQLDKLQVEGNWLVLGDKSGSMNEAIEATRLISATLARLVKGKVHLIFFDTDPRYLDATGKTYEELLEATKYVSAAGGTSIGCGLLYALSAKIQVDGIAIVSDSAENNVPEFATVYAKYSELYGEIPVYLYKMQGERTDALERDMKSAGFDLQIFDLRAAPVDYYSLPNLVATMRVNRYALVDEIMATPLLTLADVFGSAAA